MNVVLFFSTLFVCRTLIPSWEKPKPKILLFFLGRVVLDKGVDDGNVIDEKPVCYALYTRGSNLVQGLVEMSIRTGIIYTL